MYGVSYAYVWIILMIGEPSQPVSEQLEIPTLFTVLQQPTTVHFHVGFGSENDDFGIMAKHVNNVSMQSIQWPLYT